MLIFDGGLAFWNLIKLTPLFKVSLVGGTGVELFIRIHENIWPNDVTYQIWSKLDENCRRSRILSQKTRRTKTMDGAFCQLSQGYIPVSFILCWDKNCNRTLTRQDADEVGSVKLTWAKKGINFKNLDYSLLMVNRINFAIKNKYLLNKTRWRITLARLFRFKIFNQNLNM